MPTADESPQDKTKGDSTKLIRQISDCFLVLYQATQQSEGRSKPEKQKDQPIIPSVRIELPLLITPAPATTPFV